MRGKRINQIRVRDTVRIIPAHAGQTVLRWWTRPVIRDHPRTCGANTSSPTGAKRTAGSSPHMRGKRHEFQPHLTIRRIIPAHAGQTTGHLCLSTGLTDHPRTCGANVLMPLADVRLRGSSPHMRGKPRTVLRAQMRRRIIPAHAGQTAMICI